MKLIKLLTWLLMLQCVSLSAQAEDATTTAPLSGQQVFGLPQLQQQLSAHELVRGKFTQTRNLAMFSEPLVSSGNFVLSRQQGLWWQQTTPFPVSLVLTSDKLSQQFGTEKPQLMDAKDNPMVFYFSHLFLSLFQGDTQKLTEQFDISLTGNKAHWQLEMHPKGQPLSKVFSSISLNGGDNLQQLVLTEIRGDTTRIEFSQLSHPTTLSGAEQSAFAL